MPNPTILIVPGSFAAPGSYQNLVDRIRAKKHPAVAVDLLSAQKRIGLEPASMKDDAKRIRDVAEALIAQGKEVVVMCHSYGGVPTTQALAGVPVKRIVYLTAVVPKVGEAMTEAMGGPLMKVMIASAVGGYMHNDPVQLAPAIGNDFETWEEAFECAVQLPNHSAVSFQDKTTQAAYKTAPVSYIFTEKDYIILPELQEGYIKVLEEGTGKKVDVIRKPWGHCPNWRHPDELVEILLAEARK